MISLIISLLTFTLAHASFNNMADNAILEMVYGMNKITTLDIKILTSWTFNNTVSVNWYPYTDTTNDIVSKVFISEYCRGSSNMTDCEDGAKYVLDHGDNFTADRNFGYGHYKTISSEYRFFSRIVSLSGQIDFSVVIGNETRHMFYSYAPDMEDEFVRALDVDNLYNIQGHLNGTLHELPPKPRKIH